MAAAYKYVVVGGGNASGYAARAFVLQGLAAGELCIITDEPVRFMCLGHSDLNRHLRSLCRWSRTSVPRSAKRTSPPQARCMLSSG
jgi:hypothetical protein